jgi:hypothetical protein
MRRKDALALSDAQLAMVQRAAASLPLSARSGFLHDLAARLSGQPSNDAVAIAIGLALPATKGQSDATRDF